MRTDAERIDAMHKRAEEICAEDLNRKKKIYYVAAFAAGLAAIIALAFFMPMVNMSITESPADIRMNASIFGDSSVLGYIVIGIVSSLLGISLTIFCYRVGRMHKEQDK